MSYDANGNIQQYLRHGHAAGTTNFVMDSLRYNYLPGTNRLRYVRDGVATATTYTNDLENQPSNNYAYDQVGNIIGDVSEGLAYAWTNDQKLRQVDKGATTAHLTFGYDAMRNRVLKTQKVNATRSTKTYYIRDAQGNVLATYTGFVKNTVAYDSLRLAEPAGQWCSLLPKVKKNARCSCGVSYVCCGSIEAEPGESNPLAMGVPKNAHSQRGLMNN